MTLKLMLRIQIKTVLVENTVKQTGDRTIFDCLSIWASGVL